jgi:hypothetical protein
MNGDNNDVERGGRGLFGNRLDTGKHEGTVTQSKLEFNSTQPGICRKADT